MHETPLHLLEALASIEEQRHYIVGGTKDEYLLPEDLLNDAFTFCDWCRNRAERWASLSVSQRDAVTALNESLKAADVGSYDRTNIADLIERDAGWAFARQHARETLVAFGCDPPT